MLKKIISVVLAVLLCTPFTAHADNIMYGFTGGGATMTVNEYFFDEFGAILVENKEAFDGFDFEELYAGSYLLLPIMVYVNGVNNYTAVTDKMIKNDNVTFSYKTLRGTKYVEEPSIIDGKKLKLPGVAAGSYVKIPLVSDFSFATKATISMEFVLSVNNVTYQDTKTTLNCRIQPYITEVTRNTVYGAKIPTLFRVDRGYKGEVTFDFGNDIKYTSKVTKNGIYFLNMSREKNTDIVEMYPGAYLDFYSFLGDRDAFSAVGRLEIPVNVSSLGKKGEAASLYVYRIDGQTLTSLASGAVSFNKLTGRLTLNTKSLGSYVLSNQPLNRTVTSSQSDILKSGYAEEQSEAKK